MLGTGGPLQKPAARGKRRTDKLKLTEDFESKMVTVIEAFYQKVQYATCISP